jgi:ubiquinone/menaquinone biosynthesis C-methylase UbiE
MHKFDFEAEKQFSLTEVPTDHKVTQPEEVDSLLSLCTGRKDWAKLFDQKSILEVGAGECSFLPHILEVSSPKRFVATDLFLGRMDFAQRYITSSIVEFKEANILALPFNSGEFDVALAFGILHHIPNIEDAIAEISRILNPGGSFIFRDPWAGNPAVWLKYKLESGSPNEFPLFIKRIKHSFAANKLRLLFLNRFWLRYPWLPPGPWSVNIGGIATKVS